ncbi:MAG: SUMF1/EgtB/PvdO family nonheme iron enzyme [Gammaproteobacteria bacterium]|nr:SUMF1/EgtB/PvdO family nonheme iron enzyme [Gammaproteobacteria bacterium]
MSAMPKMADIKALKNLVPLNMLSNTHFEELARKATVIDIKPGKFLFKKGERDNSTCYVLSGEIALHDGTDIKLTIQGGSEEAKHPVAPQQPRQLSARAKTHCTIISIDSGLLDVMLAWEQSSGYEVAEIESDEEEDWMTRMMQSDLMQRLPATNLQQLFIRMKEQSASVGDVIVSQDDDGEYYYIIKEGKCIVSRKPSAQSRPIKLAELNNGDSFGEESLLSGAKRNATVTMLTDGRLMRLSKKDFDELLKAPLLSQLIYEDTKTLVGKGAIYLDVRLPGEYVNAHLEGSINIPLAAIRNEISNIDQSKTYIAYCDTGRRSTSAVFLLGQLGIDAHVLTNGLSSVPLAEYTNEDEIIEELEKPDTAEVININRDKESALKESEAIKAANDEKNKFKEQAEKLNRKITLLNGQIETVEKSLVEKNNEIQTLKEQVVENKSQTEEIEQELIASQELEVELEKLKSMLTRSEEDRETQKEIIASAKEAEDQAQKKIISQGEELTKFVQKHELYEIKIEQLKEKQEILKQEKDALSEDSDGNLKELYTKIENAKEAEDQAKKKIVSQSEELARFVQKHELYGIQIEQLKKEQEILKQEKEVLSEDSDESLKELHAKVESLRASIDEARVENASLEGDLVNERSKILQLRQEVESSKDKEKSISKEFDDQKALFEEDIEAKERELKEEIKSLNNKIDGLETELASEVTNGKSGADHLQQSIEDLESVREQLENKVEAANNKVDELEKINAEAGVAVKEIEDTVKSIQIEKDKTEEKYIEVTAQIEEEKQKVTSLSDDLLNARKESGEAQTEAQVNLDNALSALTEKEQILVSVQSQLDEINSGKLKAERLCEELGEEVRNLKESQQAVIDESNNKVVTLQQQMGEVSSECHSLKDVVVSLEEELKAENESKRSLEENKESDSKEMQDLLDSLKKQVEDSKEKARIAELLVNDKDKSGEELHTELAAMRESYARKESDSLELEKQIESLKAEIKSVNEKDNVASIENKDFEGTLKKLQDEHTEASNVSRERIEELEKSIQEKQLKIDEVNKNIGKESSLRIDVESSLGLMGDDLKHYKSESEVFRQKLDESESAVATLEAELNKLKDAQQDWRTTENDAAKDIELEVAKSQIKDIEQELKDSQSSMAVAKNSIDTLEKQLSMERHMSDANNNLQGQIEKLKNDMESQLSTYKSEVDTESVKLTNENKRLQEQLDRLHKDHETAVNNGKEVERTYRKQEPMRPHDAEEDHSALFDLPDMDKNLFNNRVNPAASKNNLLITTGIAVIFSILSAAGVYLFFVPEEKPDLNQVFSPVVKDKIIKKEAVTKKIETVKPAKKNTLAIKKKPLLNLDKRAKSVKKKTSVILLKSSRVFSDPLKSGGTGPVMTGVPAGNFKMGSPLSSVHFEERPQHSVSVKNFSIGKYEVTFAEYDRFSAATGRPRPSDNGWGRHKRPVVNISWTDANEYTKWLSRETGYTYRLPTEAEWEYAARAGSQTQYWWGTTMLDKRANCFNCGSQWDRVSTAPVGRFEASSLGLHDMSANVMEWVSDCYMKNYDGAPVDGSSWSNGKCESHVARGGSYRSTTDNIRVTKRSKFATETALDQVGFRVVREP